MGWQDAPVVSEGSPSVTPAWQTAPIVPPKPPGTEKSRASGDHTVRDAALNAVGSVPGVAGLENALSGITGGIGSLVDAVTGANPGTHQFAYQPRTPQGQEMQAAAGGLGNAVNEGAAKVGGAAVGALGGDQGAAEDTLRERVPEALGAIGTVAGAAGIPGLGRLAGVGEGAAVPHPATVKYGFQTAENNPIARNVAGASARPAVTSTNQTIADPILGAVAGVPQGVKLTAGKVFEDARAPADSVYQRAGASLPTAPLSPNAAQMLQGSGAEDMVVHSPDTVSQIEAQKQRLLSGPLSGPQVVDAQKALRFNGFANVGAEDPERTALGRFQLKAADALQQHMVDTLPANAPVSADQLAQARVAIAQNHTVENALGPNGNVDLQKLAKIHNANPGMLSGPMADIAQFASDHPEVTSLPSKEERFNPSGLMKDAASIDLKRPLSYVQPLFGGLARQVLTGGAEAPRVPVTGLGGEFGPIDRTPQPPPGMTASTPQAPPAPPAGPPGQIPLADLLSHGVEQPPTPGLSAGPMGAPEPQGIPFQPNLEHAAGGLSAADWLNNYLKGENNSDLPKVMSQGVPEGTMTRTGRPNNASSPNNSVSLEGEAAKNQAVAKGIQPISFGADDLEHPMSVHDIDRRDLNPAPDSIFLDKKTGSVINSGNMAPRAVQALLARWKAIHGSPPLGHAF